MKRLTIPLLISVFLIGLMFPVVGMSQPKYGGTLVIGTNDDTTSMDPHKTGENPSMWRQCFICNNLVESDAEFNIKPALATSWDVSADGKEWTFHLRKGVKFHNGREMTAKDIKWNFDRMLSPKSFFRGTLGIVESVKVVDQYTVTVILKNPWRAFLATLAGSNTQPWFIAPESENPDGSVTHPIGTGPFEFVEWKPQDHLRLKKFKDYWEKGLPYLDEVIYKVIPDKTARITALRTGDVHIAVRLPIEQAMQLDKTPKKDFYFEYLSEGKAMIIFNLSKPPFNDVRVRRAVAYAINKKEMLQAAYYGNGEVASQHFGRRSQWSCEIPEVAQDKEKAKALLKEAGYPEGFKVTWLTSRDIPYFSITSEVLQQQLKEIGITVDLEYVDMATDLSKIFKGDFVVTVGGFPEYGDPDFLYRNYFHPKGQITFFTGKAYNNPQVTAWLEESTQVADPNKRKELFCKVIKTVNEEYPTIWVMQGNTAYGVRNNAKGFKPHLGRLERYSGGGVQYTWLEK
jgi:peptide/nickel transport system substrate-binding protein